MKTSEQSWFALDIAVAPEAAEAIEFALNELDSIGTEINHLQKTPDDAVNVVGYFNELPDDEHVQDEVHYALRIHDLTEDAIKHVEKREVADQDWLHEWKKHWKPTEIGRFVIAPPWETVDDADKIVIRIEPNMAFGTGTHETTQLCVRAIENNYVAGMSFLDVGTGTGILAIAAAKMNQDVSYPAFFACDTDVDSVAIARENAELNGVGSWIEFTADPISDATAVCDFVCANLTIDVILPILPLLLKKAGRTLVLSGILIEQEEMIVSALVDFGVKNFEIERLGEWIAVTCLSEPPA